MVMVDMEIQYRPPPPLEDSLLGSPLCASDEFMEKLQDITLDISQSIDNDTLSSLDIPEYQSSSNGSESSNLLGEDYFFLSSIDIFF